MTNPPDQSNQTQPANTLITPQPVNTTPVKAVNDQATVTASNSATLIQDNQSGQGVKTVKNILLIEDDPVIIRMYSTKLTNSGYLVKEASNGEEAINILGNYKPDIILLDLMLPKIDGFGFLQQAREKITNVPVIILTNLSQDTDKSRAKDLGAVDFLVKADITPQDVVNTIQKYI